MKKSIPLIIFGFIFIIFTMELVFLFSCDPNKDHQNSEPWQKKHMESYLVYMKDKRTNVCFAMAGLDSRTLTTVPCSPEVEKGAILFQSKASNE